MKKTIKLVSSLTLVLALALTAVGCGVAYADMKGTDKRIPSVTAEAPQKTAAPTVIESPAVPSGSNAASPEPTATAPIGHGSAITAEEAKSIAQKAAGISAPHLTYAERDDGKFEVTLCDGSTEYEVDVRITDGTVLEIDRDYSGCDRCEKDPDDWNDDWDDRFDDDWDD